MTTVRTVGGERRVVSREDWLRERTALLGAEKAHTDALDALRARRASLPWVRVDKAYAFDTVHGRRTLGELFDGRSQLIVYHFMFGPGWGEGCVGCSLMSDHFDGPDVHLRNHDVTLVVCSRAPLAELQAFRERMGWRFEWVSSHGSDFNADHQVSYTPEQVASGRVWHNFAWVEMPMEEVSGVSVFAKDESGAVYHTYSCYARGGEALLGVYGFLDMTPNGRNEPDRGNLTDWVRHHDRYAARGAVDTTGRFRGPDAARVSVGLGPGKVDGPDEGCGPGCGCKH